MYIIKILYCCNKYHIIIVVPREIKTGKTANKFIEPNNSTKISFDKVKGNLWTFEEDFSKITTF